MNNLYLVFKMDIKESFRSKWFLLYTIIFGGIVALFL